MIVTTLNKIRAYRPCEEGWTKLLKYLGKTSADDEPLPFSVIVESNGIDDALWCCRSAPEYSKEWRLFAVWCARKVQHLMTDERSIKALDVAERHANGLASDAELYRAWAAAWKSQEVAKNVAATCASAAAWDVSWDTARTAVGEAAWTSVMAEQKEQFLKITNSPTH